MQKQLAKKDKIEQYMNNIGRKTKMQPRWQNHGTMGPICE